MTKLNHPTLSFGLTGCIGLMSLAATPAMAQPLIYEPFDYLDGSVLNGQNGGFGFGGAWDSTRNNPTAAAPGLEWGALEFGANAARGNAWSGVQRPLGSTLSGAGLMANGSSVWFSVIFDLTGQNTSNADLNFALTTQRFVSNSFGERENLTGGEGIGITHSGGRIQGVYWQDNDADTIAERNENNSSLYINGSGGNLNHALIVGRVDWGADNAANETLTLYAPGMDLAMGSPIMSAWSVPALDQAAFDNLALQFKDTPKMDEIRFGADYDDVVVFQPTLTLHVNTTSGETNIIGPIGRDVAVNGYQVTSDAGSLDAEGWRSFADQDLDGNGPPSGTGDGWEETGGVGPEALGEYYLLGDSEILANATMDLGAGYDQTIDVRDLGFRYRTDQGFVFDGDVTYFSPVLGDLNNDGLVDGDDLADALIAFSGANGSLDLGWGDGDIDADGDVDNKDLGVIIGEFDGVLSVQAANRVLAETSLDIAAIQALGVVVVPEPTTLTMLGLAGLLVVRRRRNN